MYPCFQWAFFNHHALLKFEVCIMVIGIIAIIVHVHVDHACA